jgi:mannose-6-phosphate isomerase-like protein (cupin superfamily)
MLTLAGALAGCRPRADPTLIWEGVGAPVAKATTTSIARLPTAAPGVRRGIWGDAAAATFELLASDRSEEPHVHRDHDLTVVLLRGAGNLVVEDRTYELHAGDVVHVIRGRNHHFHPDVRTPAAALAIFTPILQGRDFEPASDMRR